MALSTQERQQRYQRKVRHGKLARIQVTVDLDTSIHLKWLCQKLNSSRTALISRLINEEWDRQGQPTG